MPSRSTRYSLELLGEDLGSVEPENLTTEVQEWPPFFRANWRNPTSMSVSTSWLTDVTASKEDLIEERRGLWERPIRNCRLEMTGMNQLDTIRLQNFCARAGKSRQPMPIYPDRIKTYTASAGQVLSARVSWMRFYKGQRIALVKPDYSPWAAGGEAIFAEVNYFDEDLIFLTSPLPETIPERTLVYPLLDSEYVEQTSGFVITDHLSTIAFRYQERNGMMTLPPAWNGEIELLTDYAYGYPVFSFRPNFAIRVTERIVRSVQRVRSGRSTHIDEDGTRPYFAFDFAVTTTSRKASWDLLRFFDSRRGRLKPFILISWLELIKITAIDTASVSFESVGRLNDFNEFYDYIALIYNDGTKVLRKISATFGSSLLFDVPISNPSDVKKATFAYFGRFGTDIMSQVWRTDLHCSAAFSFRELPSEFDQ